MKLEATLDRSLAQMKSDLGHDPDAPASNPFGPDSSTAGSHNWAAHNSRYLGNAPGGANFKGTRWLATKDDRDEAVQAMIDATEAELERRGEMPEPELLQDATRNFLQSTLTAKFGWKSDAIEEAAAEALAEELGGTLLHGESPDTAAEMEGNSIDRRILVDGETVTVQVKTNTDKPVKPKNRDKVDYRLGVTAEEHSKEITVEVEEV